MLPALPPDFFQPAELQAITGRKQRAHILQWLKNSGIPHVVGLHGWPMVYRSNMLPQQGKEAQNDHPIFDFSAAHATSRKAAHGRT